MRAGKMLFWFLSVVEIGKFPHHDGKRRLTRVSCMVDIEEAVIGIDRAALVTDDRCFRIAQKIVTTAPDLSAGRAGLKCSVHQSTI